MNNTYNPHAHTHIELISTRRETLKEKKMNDIVKFEEFCLAYIFVSLIKQMK
jgi:hypothetical protein